MQKLLLSLVLLGMPLAAQEYKIAVIGLVHSHVWGHIGKMVKGDPAKLVGVAETEPELVAEAKKRGVQDNQIYSDYNKMLDETKPDIVWAFVENNRHLEIAKACAGRKINIIYEKPLAASLKDSLAIRDLAKQSGIRVMTNYQMAWWPANYTAKQVADSGDIGKVWRLRGIVGHGGPGDTGTAHYFFTWLTDPVKNGAGALMDFGCYNALWSLWYLGKPETVYATVNHIRPDVFPKVEDNANLELHYKNGVGVFEGSWDLPRSFQDLEVFGNGPEGTSGSVYMKNGSVEMRKGKETKQVQITPLPPERSEPIAYMVDCIKNNRAVEGMTALDINVDVVRIIELAKESVRTGKPVPYK